MGKLRKLLFIFSIIIIQSVLAVTAGIAAISYVSRDSLPPYTYVGNLNIGNMKKDDAARKIVEYFNTLITNGSLSISVDGKGEYLIPFKDFDVRIDGMKTLDTLGGWKSAEYIQGMFKSYFGRARLDIKPVFTYNDGILRQKLIDLSKKTDVPPINAFIAIENGQLVKRAETAGYILNIENASVSIRRHMNQDFQAPVMFNRKDDFEIQTVNPEIMLKEFTDIDQVIAEYSTVIEDNELAEFIKSAAGAINGVVLAGKGKAGDSFSFIEKLKKADKSFENDNDGYDQVASTLYAAILEGGIDKNLITRLKHELAPDYIDAGLDAWISENGGDLKFLNTLDHKLAIFSSIEGDKLFVRLAGNLKDRGQELEIKVEIVQRYEPSVVYIENHDLKQGEKVQLSPGKDGLLVKVYRNNELISTDEYEAEKSIVQVGPKTDWNSGLDVEK